MPASMSDKMRGEFTPIVQWTEPHNNEVIAYPFPCHNNELKFGAKLVVRQGQAAVFVN